MIEFVRVGLIFVGCLLGACSTVQPVVPKTPGQAIYELEGTYAGALSVALSYKGLPACVPGGNPVCSDLSTVHHLQEDEAKAYPVLMAADAAVRAGTDPQAISRAISDASAAVSVFVNDTNTLRTK